MFFRMDKDFSCTLLYITVHIFEYIFCILNFKLKLDELDVRRTIIVFQNIRGKQILTHWEIAHTRRFSFWERIAALNQISQHHRKEVLVFVKLKIPKWSKRYLACYKWKAWFLDNSSCSNFSEIWKWCHILISSWCHSYDFIDVL